MTLPARRPRPTRVAALAIAAGLAIAGCSTDRVGAAAIVGSERIPVAELHERVDELARRAGTAGLGTADLADQQRSLLERRINHELHQRVAEQEGIEVTRAEIDARIAEVREQVGGDDAFAQALAAQGFTEESLRDVVYDELVRRKLGDDAERLLLAEVDDVGVWVSPRYGTYTRGRIEPRSGSLSVPDEGGAPAPSEPAAE